MINTRAAAASAILLGLVLGVSGCGSSAPGIAVPHTTGASAPTNPTTGPTTGTPTPSTPVATECNPPGDIPDNSVYLDHRVPGSTVHLTVPEGWSQTTTAGVLTWTDKYNSISVEVRPRSTAPSVASARAQDVPALMSSVPKFVLGQITSVTRKHGSAVHITYLLDSAANPVTGKVVRDVAERFEFWRAGQEAILTLVGPQHADNVDPWRVVADSLQWR